MLLGDVLELRHRPPRDAMAAARPFFEDLGQALAGREIVVSAGNHDHPLIEPWLGERALQAPEPLGLEQRLLPEQASPMLARLAEWAAPARMSVAYPGLWVRPDVYATHGHYLDCHLTVPTLERLSVAAMSRVLGLPAASFSRVEDYEAVGAPVFAWRDTVAREARTGHVSTGRHDPRVASALQATDDGSSRVRKLRAARARGRVPARRRGAQPRRAGPAADRHLDRGAAPRGAARDGRGGRASRPGRRVRGLRPHPPRRAAPGR